MNRNQQLQLEAHEHYRRCAIWLRDYIRPGWPKYLPKAELRDRAIVELKISNNAFDFAWIEVIEETGCGEWYEPLRMRKTASKRS